MGSKGQNCQLISEKPDLFWHHFNRQVAEIEKVIAHFQRNLNPAKRFGLSFFGRHGRLREIGGVFSNHANSTHFRSSTTHAANADRWNRRTALHCPAEDPFSTQLIRVPRRSSAASVPVLTTRPPNWAQ
ncbi:hypothetical protein [Fimbriiglobus ruber]|uniref:hypothetical protein n=1 Tax=Fimbriiglobus ruber TaxID=1908690 RepID=UPI00137B302B|nr:hypothetical protein [Fimbriiglobus ruber]